MIHFLFQVWCQRNFFSLKVATGKSSKKCWFFRIFRNFRFFWNFDIFWNFSCVHISLHFGSVTILSKYNKSRFHAKKTFIWLVCWVKDQDKYIIYDSHAYRSLMSWVIQVIMQIFRFWTGQMKNKKIEHGTSTLIECPPSVVISILADIVFRPIIESQVQPTDSHSSCW